MILVSASASRLRQVTELIKEALRVAGIEEEVVSSEDLAPEDLWLERFRGLSEEARCVVFDLSRAGPHVQLEYALLSRNDESAGPRRARDRRVLLLAEDIDSVPAHLGTYQVLIYGGSQREAVRLVSRHLAARYGRSRLEPSPPSIFVSYAHEDVAYLDRLAVHMRPLVREGLIDRWDDRRIRVGDRWQAEISAALERSAAAVLLVSADFYASDFIIEDELPPLLAAAKRRGVRIYPLIVSFCRYRRDDRLAAFAAHNDPAEPLAALPAWQRDAVYDSLTAEIERDLSLM